MGFDNSVEIVSDSDSSTPDVTPAVTNAPSPYMAAFGSYRQAVERAEQAGDSVHKARTLGASEIEIAPLLIASARAPRAVERATVALDEINKARQIIERANARIEQAVNDAAAAAVTALRSLEATDKAFSLIVARRAKTPVAAAPPAPIVIDADEDDTDNDSDHGDISTHVIEIDAPPSFDDTDPVDASAIEAIARVLAEKPKKEKKEKN
jgi:hypothetical protein